MSAINKNLDDRIDMLFISGLRFSAFELWKDVHNEKHITPFAFISDFKKNLQERIDLFMAESETSVAGLAQGQHGWIPKNSDCHELMPMSKDAPVGSLIVNSSRGYMVRIEQDMILASDGKPALFSGLENAIESADKQIEAVLSMKRNNVIDKRTAFS